MTQRRTVGVLALVAMVLTVFGANWAIGRFGLVSVGLGLMAPAGVYFIGLTFTCRDIVQNTIGRAWSLLAILVAAGLSAYLSPHIATASAMAALLGELSDFAVYTPLLKRGWLKALIPANIVGLAVDSAVFLWLAFGSLSFIEGQIVGKAWMTVLAVIILLPVRRAYVLRPQAA